MKMMKKIKKMKKVKPSLKEGSTPIWTDPNWTTPNWTTPIWTNPTWTTPIWTTPNWTKGTPPGKKNVFFRALPKLPLPPIRATCTTFSAVKKEYIKCIF